MKKCIFIFASFVLSQAALAAIPPVKSAVPDMTKPGYEIKLNVSVHGKYLASPAIITKAGETATTTITNGAEKTFIQVTPTERMMGQKPGVLMKFVVGTIDAKGYRKIIASPHMTILEDHPGQMVEGDTNGQEVLKMSVTAKSKAL
jgi:hypothetical protein